MHDKTYTWTHPDRMTARKIDHIAINKYRNAVIRSREIHAPVGNMERQRHRAVIRVVITQNLMGKYHMIPIPERGAEIKIRYKATTGNTGKLNNWRE